MPLQCNIDARGKALRLTIGLLSIAVGIGLMAAWGWMGQSLAGWIVGAACVAAGAFAVFEARKGWCALRAIGMKTPI